LLDRKLCVCKKTLCVQWLKGLNGGGCAASVHRKQETIREVHPTEEKEIKITPEEKLDIGRNRVYTSENEKNILIKQ
jgi:hypothetical protein